MKKFDISRYVDKINFYRHVLRICRYHRHIKNHEIPKEATQMQFQPDKPYNDLPELPPSHDVESKAILKACIGARAALAELKISGSLIPNQTILINSIPLLEAQASSEIENIVTTTDKLFRFANETTEKTDPATKETLRYRTALYQGFKMLSQRPVSTSMAVTICQTIKGVDLNIRATPGTALLNEATGRVIYTPPEGQRLLREKLSNWEKYIHEAEDVDPLIRLAIMHYQFEAIHPFTDGNGRTGRVLNLLYLVDKGLLDTPVLYLSRYIIENRRDYYKLLLNVTMQGAWEDWILYMLKSIKETAEWSIEKIKAIRDLIDDTATKVRHDFPRIYSRELIEVIFVNTYCRVGDVVKAGVAKRQSASLYLKALTSSGILEEFKSGRENIYINVALLELLTKSQ